MSSDSYLEVVKSLSAQLENASSIELKGSLPAGSFSRIVISGMGGSSIAGGILQSYLSGSSKIPVFLSRSYAVPEFVDRYTLVFVISYSGNTEETLSSLRSAFRKGSAIIAVASGGKLLNKAVESKIPYIKIPSGLQPRASLAYQLLPILNVLYRLRLVKDSSRDIAQAIAAVKKTSYDERAKSLASKLIGRIPLVYASARFASVAYRWKTQFNENSKVHAFSNEFSELNHNEIVAFTNLNGSYHVIMLEDEEDHPRVKARMRLTKEILSKRNVPSTHIVIKGENLLLRLFYAVYLGDLTSIYLALVTNTDPEPVKLIEGFKQQLDKVPYV